MPKTKNPLLRYKLLDQFFRNIGRTYTFSELSDSLQDEILALDIEAKDQRRFKGGDSSDAFSSLLSISQVI